MRHANGIAVARVAAGVVVVLGLAAGAGVPASAGWLTGLARGASEAGEAGIDAARGGGVGALGGIAAARRLLQGLPQGANGAAALAADVSAEGHWTFVNRAGETFTAGTPSELARAVPTLLPDAAAGTPLALYVTETTAFDGRAFLKDLPARARLTLVVGSASFPLLRGEGSAGLMAEVRPGLRLGLEDAAPFHEALWQLERPLNTADIRLIGLSVTGADHLAAVPKFDPATRIALVDTINPDRLATALADVRGQTILLTGRLDGETLLFEGGGASTGRLRLIEVEAACAGNDVNLVILDTGSARQPGGRNWLWQRVAVMGLPAAMNRATFGDFLAELGASHGGLDVGGGRIANGRVSLLAVPGPGGGSALPASLGEWLESVTTETLGHVVPHAVHATLRDRARQTELDSRLVPGIPAALQQGYIGLLFLGLFGLPVARGWFDGLWPLEHRSDYAGALGYRLAWGVRWLVLTFAFAPAVALAAAPVRLVRAAGGILRHGLGRILFPFRNGHSSHKVRP